MQTLHQTQYYDTLQYLLLVVSYELPPVLSDEKDCIYDVLYFRFRHPEGHGESDMSRFKDLWSKGGVGVRERRRDEATGWTGIGQAGWGAGGGTAAESTNKQQCVTNMALIAKPVLFTGRQEEL